MTEANQHDSGEPRKHLLFLSYAGDDGLAATRLARDIEATAVANEHGLKVWLDRRPEAGLGLDATRPRQEQVAELINSRSTAFACFVGAQGAVNWVEEEIRLGLKRAVEDPAYAFFTFLAEGRRAHDLPGFTTQRPALRLGTEEADFENLARALLAPENYSLGRVEEPFPGLDPFDAARQHLFFGRERETEEVLERLRDRRLVMIVGESGAGKSSLAKAGVVCRWRGGALAPSETQPQPLLWHVVEARPGRNAFRSLGEAVSEAARALGRSAEERETFARWFAEGTTEQRRDALRCGLPAERTRTLLVVDQFEDLFTQCPDTQRSAFLTLLLDLADEGDPAFTVLLAMQSDHRNLLFGTPLNERLEEENRKGFYPLGRMSLDGLKAAIEEPLRLAGLAESAVREELSAAALKDADAPPGDLALLQFALFEAWERSRQEKIPFAQAYAETGGRYEALPRAAERLFSSDALLTEAEQALAETVFVRLVRLGDAGRATRALASRNMFDEKQWSLIQKLADIKCRRLVRVRGEGDATSVELAHDVLLTHWPRLQARLHDAAPEKRLLDALNARTEHWLAARNGREKRERLPTGGDLEAGETLLRDRPEWISPDERAFLAAGAKKRAAEQAGRKRRVAVATGAAFLFAAFGGGLGWFLYKTETARALAARERDQAQATQSRFLADLSRQAVAQGDPIEGMLWALEGLPGGSGGLERPWAPAAEISLYAAYVERRQLAKLQLPSTVWSAVFSPDGETIATVFQDSSVRLWNAADGTERVVLSGHAGFVRAAAFSPDGRRLATASADKTIRLWDVASGGQIATFSGHSGEVTSVVYSPGGARIASGSADGTARLWDAASGKPVATLSGHSGSVRSVVFSPEGARMATTSNDSSIRIWDAVNGAQISSLVGHTSAVWSVAFSPDGVNVATGSADNTARFWDAKTGLELAVLRGHEGPVTSIAFSPDGNQLATASDDSTTRLWDTRTGRLIATLEGHTARVLGLAFSPDGTRLATASQDGTVRLWDTGTGAALAAFAGHSGWVADVSFSPDGSRLATASHDRTVRLWDSKTADEIAVLMGHARPVRSVAFSADGLLVASASEDSGVRVWDGRTGAARLTVNGHTAPVRAVAFSPDGTRLATASEDDSARLWDAKTGGEIAALDGHEGPVTGIAFSPDGKQIATASEDDAVRLWDAETATQVAALEGHEAPVMSLAFSPDGKQLATASEDKTVRLWDVAARTEQRRLVGHLQTVTSVAFSADGKLLATGSEDGSARVWNPESGAEIAALQGDGGAVRSVALSPDGTRLATGSGDVFLRIWDVATASEVARLRGHTKGIDSVAFSPDGTRLVSGSEDNTVRLWRTLPVREALIEAARRFVPHCLSAEQRKRGYLEPEPPAWCVEMNKPRATDGGEASGAAAG